MRESASANRLIGANDRTLKNAKKDGKALKGLCAASEKALKEMDETNERWVLEKRRSEQLDKSILELTTMSADLKAENNELLRDLAGVTEEKDELEKRLVLEVTRFERLASEGVRQERQRVWEELNEAYAPRFERISKHIEDKHVART